MHRVAHLILAGSKIRYIFFYAKISIRIFYTSAGLSMLVYQVIDLSGFWLRCITLLKISPNNA